MRRGVALPRRLAPFLPLRIPDRMEDPDAWRGPMDHHGHGSANLADKRAVLALFIWTDGEARATFFARVSSQVKSSQVKSGKFPETFEGAKTCSQIEH